MTSRLRWLFLCITVLCSINIFAEDINNNITQCLKQNSPQNQDIGKNLLWYRTSLEQYAIFQETYTNALDSIAAVSKSKNLPNGSWGVIMSIDNTILDTSDYQYAQIAHCASNNYNDYIIKYKLPNLPVAPNFTCQIESLGGRVFLVTNRNGNGDIGKKIQAATVQNLKSNNICYDSILFANNSYDTNKNPRFTAIKSGDYENIITTKALPATEIIAYIGNDIIDFPDLKQSDNRQDSNEFINFGKSYFILPNPIYGSWSNNHWKE